MPKISVIVPVYNTEKYLSRCIDSILNQTFTDFELILVNDGSTDNSGSICNKYVHKDSRIKVFHQENQGVSSARNLGINKSSGKYLSFIDSDDTIPPHYFNLLLNNDNNIDLIICGYLEICLNGKKIKHLYNIPSQIELNKADIIKYIISSTFTSSNLTNSCCNKIYHCHIVKSNNLYFENRKRGEDWLFNINYLQLINSAIYYNNPIYNYHRNEIGAMSKPLVNQFSLWIDNRHVRYNLINKYKLNVNYYIYNSIWVNKVINYIFEIIDFKLPNYKQIIYSILTSSELNIALKYSSFGCNIYKPLYFLLLKKQFKLSYLYILLLNTFKRLI